MLAINLYARANNKVTNPFSQPLIPVAILKPR